MPPLAALLPPPPLLLQLLEEEGEGVWVEPQVKGAGLQAVEEVWPEVERPGDWEVGVARERGSHPPPPQEAHLQSV